MSLSAVICLCTYLNIVETCLTAQSDSKKHNKSILLGFFYHNVLQFNTCLIKSNHILRRWRIVRSKQFYNFVTTILFCSPLLIGVCPWISGELGLLVVISINNLTIHTRIRWNVSASTSTFVCHFLFFMDNHMFWSKCSDSFVWKHKKSIKLWRSIFSSIFDSFFQANSLSNNFKYSKVDRKMCI